MKTLKEYNYIIYNKQKLVDEKKYNEACEWRTKEINFMLENFGIDVRSQFVKDFEEGLDTNIVGMGLNKSC